MAIKTYFIGGIATDKTLYHHQLTHIPHSIYLPFPKHDEHDTMESYVLKFIPLIDLSGPFHLVGCSMGGIMVMELLNHIQPSKVVLISSVKSRNEMPWLLRQLKHTKLHRLLPGNLYIRSIEIGSYLLPEISKKQKLREQVIQMANNNSPEFLSWCINAIVNWNGRADVKRDIFHIHGNKDKMFPIKNIKGAYEVKNGTHNMLLTQEETMTELLLKYLYSA